MADAEPKHFDVLIVGAGLSGIDAAWRLQEALPNKSYAILEGRETIGGTWDLFRYPGVRSDSDMHTLGFPFRPWRAEKAIVEGPAIRAYIEETAREGGIDRHILFSHRVVRAAWSSAEALWTLEAETPAGPARFTAPFLYLGSGYYRYEQGYRPEWPGEAGYRGRIVHPQHWPEDLDFTGKRVVVIGSGATAVTLVPAMTDRAAHVTMLQRSPTYIVARPSRDRLARRVGPRLARLKNVLLGLFFFNLARRRPERVRAKLIDLARGALPDGYDVERHFAPRYNPWDQRLCLVPDGDLFEAIGAGRASVVTDEIDGFTADGIRLASGEVLPADIVVTATGLTMVAYGEIDMSVDGRPVESGRLHVYKGMMFDGVPNMAWCVGYTNASWTLRADLTSRYVCRLLNYMGRHRIDIATPTRDPAQHDSDEPLMNLTSGYVRRAADLLPRQGTRRPWRMRNNYLTDLPVMRLGRIDDGSMRFARAKATV